AIQRLAVGPDRGKDVEDPDGARMLVQQLSEVRLTQPSVDPRADLDADDLRNVGGPAEPPREIHLAEAALAVEPIDLILQSALGANQKVLGTYEGYAAHEGAACCGGDAGRRRRVEPRHPDD